jgi:hypothetical protein
VGIVRILIKIVTAAPMLRYIAEKANGYKTVIGAIGLAGAILGHVANALYPGLVDPALMPPQDLEAVFNGAIGAFGTLFGAGAAHKAVKQRKAERELAELKEKLAWLEKYEGENRDVK